MQNTLLYILFTFFILNTSIGQNYRAEPFISPEASKRIKRIERKIAPGTGNNPVTQFDINKLLQKEYVLISPEGNAQRFKADTIIHRKSGLISWVGKNLSTNDWVNYVINLNTQSINGSLVIGNEAYEVFSLDPSITLMVSYDSFSDLECGNTSPPPFLSTVPRSTDHSRMTSQDCNLRGIFAYTPGVRSAVFDIRGLIQAAIDYTNLAYDNSLIDFYLEAAFVYETNYVETGDDVITCWIDGLGYPDVSEDLCRFHHTGDGWMDEVHDYRDQYKADVCILFVDSLVPGKGGESFLPPVINAGEAFAVVLFNNTLSTTAHEIGHIQGCHHDYDADPTWTNNHGYVHIGATVEESFKTVMAYNNQCNNNFGQGCRTIPYFSDPNIFFEGVPIGETDPAGIDGAMNAINIMNQKALVNGFRNYPAFNTLPATTLPSETFAYSIASTEVGNLNTYVIEDSSEVHFSSEDYITLRPGFQSQVGAFFEGRIGTECDPVNVNPGTICKEFGYSIDIDDTLAIIGAPRDSRWNVQGGAAFLYERISGIWQAVDTLYSPATMEGDRYGHSVAIHDSLIVIGAPNKEALSPRSGIVYVYEITDSTINRIGTFLNGTAHSSGDMFGYDVDVFNKTIVIGNPGDNQYGTNAGSISVFTRLDSTWNAGQELFFPGIGAEDRFGESVSIYGNYILAGAPGFDSLQLNQGKAIAFQRSFNTWYHMDELYGHNIDKGAGFGHSVALSSTQAVVGAPFDNSNGLHSGSAHFYYRGLSSFTPRNSSKPSDLDAYDHFGYSVAIDGATAMVGAPGKGSDITNITKVYHFDYEPTFWSLDNIIQQPSSVAAKFGHDIALSDTLAVISALGDYPICNTESEVRSYIQAPNGFWILEPTVLESVRQVETSTSIRQDEGIRRE